MQKGVQNRLGIIPPTGAGQTRGFIQNDSIWSPHSVRSGEERHQKIIMGARAKLKAQVPHIKLMHVRLEIGT